MQWILNILHQFVPVVPALSIFKIKKRIFCIWYFFHQTVEINKLHFIKRKNTNKVINKIIINIIFIYSFYFQTWYTGWITHNYNIRFIVSKSSQVLQPDQQQNWQKSDCKADRNLWFFILVVPFSYKVGACYIPSLTNIFPRLVFQLFSRDYVLF